MENITNIKIQKRKNTMKDLFKCQSTLKKIKCGNKYLDFVFEPENTKKLCLLCSEKIRKQEKQKLILEKRQIKELKQKLVKKRIPKLLLLQDFLLKNKIDFQLAKTNSLYIKLDGVSVKISNHQLIDFGFLPFEKGNGKKIIKSNANINLQVLDNYNGYDFSDLQKYYFEYGKEKNAVTYWIPIFGNYSIEKLKEVILNLKLKIEKENE